RRCGAQVRRQRDVARLANEQHVRAFKKQRHRTDDYFRFRVGILRERFFLTTAGDDEDDRQRQRYRAAHYVPVLVVGLVAVVVGAAGAAGAGWTMPMRVS